MTRKTYAFPDFGSLSRNLDPQWIAQALAATQTASVRKRKLPASQVIWLVIALAMYRHQSMAQVVADLDLVLPDEINPDIAKSALTQARQRLGQEAQALTPHRPHSAQVPRRPQGPARSRAQGVGCHACAGP
jgi:hypothetical protein